MQAKAVIFGRGSFGNIVATYVAKHYEILAHFDSKAESSEIIAALKKAQTCFVITPLQSHFSLCKLALEHSCDVFVEKPATATKAQLELLLSLAKSKNRILFVDYIYTFSRSINYALSLLQKHLELESSPKNSHTIEASMTQYGKFYENESVLEVLGVHYLSVFALLTLPPLDSKQKPVLENLQVKEALFLDTTKQSVEIVLSATYHNAPITLKLSCSLLSKQKSRILTFHTKEGTLQVDMLQANPLHFIPKSKQATQSLPLFDENNNLILSLEQFQKAKKESIYAKWHYTLCESIASLLESAKLQAHKGK